MKKNDWLKEFNSELSEFLEQLLPLPAMIEKYIEEINRLEAELLIISNILIKKGLIKTSEIDTMKKIVFAEKKKELEKKIEEKPHTLNRKEYEEMLKELHKLENANKKIS